MLNLPDFLKPLQFVTQPYPRAAVAAVLTRREEAIPALLQVLKQVPFEWAKGEWNPDWMIHEFALYLLSEFGEQRAFPLILEIARLPALDDLLGDGVTESLPKALAATFSGELSVFYPLIEDQVADEFARGAALCAIGVLFKQERVTPLDFESCLMEVHGIIELEPTHVWDMWVSLVVDFRCTFLLDKVRALYERGFADSGFQLLADVEAQLRKGEGTGDVSYTYRAFTNVHDDMSSWYCFSDEYASRSDECDGNEDDDDGCRTGADAI